MLGSIQPLVHGSTRVNFGADPNVVLVVDGDARKQRSYERILREVLSQPERVPFKGGKAFQIIRVGNVPTAIRLFDETHPILVVLGHLRAGSYQVLNYISQHQDSAVRNTSVLHVTSQAPVSFDLDHFPTQPVVPAQLADSARAALEALMEQAAPNAA